MIGNSAFVRDITLSSRIGVLIPLRTHRGDWEYYTDERIRESMLYPSSIGSLRDFLQS